MKEMDQLARILEGALFAAQKPMSVDRLLELFDEEDRPEKQAIKNTLIALQEDYQQRGVALKELATGYQFQICPDLAKWVQRLWEERAPRYSRALLETLALIAYRQPITRSEIEDIRGVAVNSNITKTLLEREWIRIVGYRDVPGRPALMATTKEFLDYFGLRSLEELPPLSELQDLDKLGEHLAERLQAGLPIDENAQADDQQNEVAQDEIIGVEKINEAEENNAISEIYEVNQISENEETAEAYEAHEANETNSIEETTEA